MQFVIGLGADGHNGVAIEATADVCDTVFIYGGRAFRVVDRLPPELPAVGNPHGQDKSRIAGRLAIGPLNRPRTNHRHIAKDRRRGFDMQRRLHRPMQLVRRSLKTQQRAIVILMESLTYDEIFAIASERRRAEEWPQNLATGFGDLPEWLTCVGVDARQKTDIAAQVALASGRIDPAPRHHRFGEKHGIRRAEMPEWF